MLVNVVGKLLPIASNGGDDQGDGRDKRTRLTEPGASFKRGAGMSADSNELPLVGSSARLVGSSPIKVRRFTRDNA